MSGWLWLRVSRDVAAGMSAGAVSSEGLTGSGGSVPKTAPSHLCLAGAGC